MSKDVNELMNAAGITQEELDTARSSESVFLHYMITGRPVYVEFIAPNFVETLLQLQPAIQSCLIAAVLDLVPKIGDQEIIIDDHGNGKKHRGARVIRMRSDNEDHIELLITR